VSGGEDIGVTPWVSAAQGDGGWDGAGEVRLWGSNWSKLYLTRGLTQAYCLVLFKER